jgi:hypothetical protein
MTILKLFLLTSLLLAFKSYAVPVDFNVLVESANKPVVVHQKATSALPVCQSWKAVFITSYLKAEKSMVSKPALFD